jgi:hypothetical protein
MLAIRKPATAASDLGVRGLKRHTTAVPMKFPSTQGAARGISVVSQGPYRSTTNYEPIPRRPDDGSAPRARCALGIVRDEGGGAGRLGYFFFLSRSESGRFLNPPEPRELHDPGYGGRGTAQIDYQTDKNVWKLLLLGGGNNFQQPDNLEQAAQVKLFGPVSGGFPGEYLAPGERIFPAFNQKHTATADIFYRNHWQDFWTGFVFRYGSGTPQQEDLTLNGEEVKIFNRLPQHFTADSSAGLALWKRESSRLALEFDLSNNICRISKESETTPIQFAQRRVVAGRLTWHF